MAFRYIFVISALVVLTQGSYLSPVDQESDVGVHHSGVASSGASGSGAPRGHPSGSQPQRPASGYGSTSGSVGGPRRSSGSNTARPRPHGGTSRRSSGASLNRPYGSGNRHPANRPAGGANAGHGNPQQNRNQKPY
ncbi:keratin, type I cytoskeletal 9-like [Drosophila kikkawai]|uniref:Keratin, type I cytoskeletal 9-like n=1 Tax=Drosophila kikkawai TaxID=30033 RepID=A0A6P4II16_DROKI|nr:translation initiation factor IF-2-like [Drosophila kikkawai]